MNQSPPTKPHEARNFSVEGIQNLPSQTLRKAFGREILLFCFSYRAILPLSNLCMVAKELVMLVMLVFLGHF